MLRFVPVLLLTLMLTSATAVAQAEPRKARPFTFSAGVGPARAMRGVDARGIEAQGGIALGLGHGFGLRLEASGHWFAEQPLYPCIIQDATRCYQTINRTVAAGILNAAYHMSRLRTDKGRTIPYLITGLGLYQSRRLATRYNDCQPVGPCDRGTYRLELRDTQFGWSGGVGADFELGSLPVFAETRLHYVYNDRPGGQSSNDYFLWPLSVGIRF